MDETKSEYLRFWWFIKIILGVSTTVLYQATGIVMLSLMTAMYFSNHNFSFQLPKLHHYPLNYWATSFWSGFYCYKMGMSMNSLKKMPEIWMLHQNK